MADPGKFQYVLDGKGVTFVNENDNKIIIRSEKPVVTVDDSGIERPLLGTLSLTGSAPLALGRIEIPTGALTFTGTVPVFDAPIPVSLGTLTIAGKVPTLGATVTPTVGSIAFTEYNPARWTGLWFEGYAPTTVVAEVALPGLETLTFASEKPDVSSSSATLITRVPPKVAISLAGQAPLAAVANVVLPTLGTIAITGRLTAVNDFAYPSTGSLNITGYVPDVIGEGAPTVIIEGPFNYGTFIRNLNADDNVDSNYQIDDRTGFKIKVKDPMVEEYTGNLVRPDSLDRRSQQEFLRSKGEHHRGPQRPEGDETFIDPDNPVTIDDL